MSTKKISKQDELNWELSLACHNFLRGSIADYDRLSIVENKVKFLIECGADPNMPYAARGMSCHAVIEEYCCVPEVLEILLKNGGDPNYHNEEGNPLAHSVVGMGHAGYYGGTAANLRALKLLKEYGGDIAALNDKGESILYAPMHWLSLSDEIASFALENGCKPMSDKETAFVEMRINKIKEGAPIRKQRMNRRDCLGYDLLTEKTMSFHGDDVVERYQGALRQIKFFERQNTEIREALTELGPQYFVEIQEDLFRHQQIKKAKESYRKKRKKSGVVKNNLRAESR